MEDSENYQIYDSLGSMTFSASPTYDDNDRLLTETTNGVTTYSYDDNGNLISEISLDQQTTYIWSAENRLMGAEITDANGTQVIEYAYDADGVRVAKTVDGDETRYLIDANRQYAQVLEEYDASTGTEVAYVHGNELISQSRGGAESVYLYDGHSGTRQLTDEAGAVTDSYLYDAYGNVLKRIGDTENSYLYRGEQSDSETGLQYLRARYNDTTTGRFISTDPFEGMMDVPMSRHRYLYGYNNPLTYIDPSGMVNVSELSVTQLAATILAGLGTGVSLVQQIQSSIAYSRGSDSLQWDGELFTYTLPNIDPFPGFFARGFGSAFGSMRFVGFDIDLFVTDSQSGGEFEYRDAPVLALSASTGNSSSVFVRPGAVTYTTFQVKTPLGLGFDVNRLSGGFVSGAFGISGNIGPLGASTGIQPILLGNGSGDANGDAFGIGLSTGVFLGAKIGLSIALPSEPQRVTPTPQGS